MMKTLFALLTAVMLMMASTLQAASYTIYPVPHSLTMGAASCTISPVVNIQADATIDEATVQRAKDVLQTAGCSVTVNAPAQAGVTQLLLTTTASTSAVHEAVTTNFAPDMARLLRTGKFDRHMLIVSTLGVAIMGEDTNATFFGLASLEQMLEQRSADGSLATVTIYDYADQKNRGLVEGYYGYPYSVSVKKDLMRFMMRHKMNTYMYGAKSDPYHSQYWQQPYPTSITAEQEKNGWLSQDMVRDLAETSTMTKVNFIWAIHPGNNFLGSNTVISDIMGKFADMHRLGIRQFAVFVDDVSIPSSQADMTLNATRITALQQAIEARWNRPDALPTDTVRPLHFVPQIYCSSFASSTQQRQDFMAALGHTPSYITVYTTGQGVWTVPNSGHMQNMHNELGRDMAWWWNYPCNDNADGQIYTMDMYSNFRDLPAVDGNATLPAQLTNTIGLVANPMQEGEVAKTALFSVADYAWNNAGFNNQKSWEASFASLIGDEEMRESYRYITRYLRWNEPSSLKTLIDAYKAGLSAGNPDDRQLRALMNEIIGHCTTVEKLALSDTESDRLLYTDLCPWLFKLRDDCRTVLMLMDVAQNADRPTQRWADYLSALDALSSLSTSHIYTAYALEGMGSGISVSQRQAQPSQLYLEPFLIYMREHAMQGCFSSQLPAARATDVTNVPSLRPTVTTTDDVVTVSASQRVYAQGHFSGILLPHATLLDSIHVSDTLFTRHAILYSSNGKEWHRLAQADVAPETPVRYFVVANDTDVPTSFRIYKNDIKLFLPQPTAIADILIPTDREVWQGHVKDYIVDGDYTTFCTLNRNQQSTDTYTVDLGSVQTIHDVRICMGTVNGDYMTEGRVSVSEDGNRWFALRAMGVTDHFRYTLDMPQNVRYSNEMTYCDFDGRQQQARYVRLSIKTPNTSKWLRLYEMEVNRTHYETSRRQLCTSGTGLNLPAAIDGDGATFIPAGTPSPVTFHLEALTPASAVTVYCDPASISSAPVVEAIDADGNITPLGTLRDAIHRFDLTSCPQAVALRISYEGDAPAIHEFVPTFEDTPIPLPTSIVAPWASPQGSADSAPIYDLQGRRLQRAPRHGLYIRAGKVVAQ